MTARKTHCDLVRRNVAGKTRDDILDAIRTEFDLPKPRVRVKHSSTTKPAPAKRPREPKS